MIVLCSALSWVPLRMNRYYFQVLDANIFECVFANTFLEAKQKAFAEYAPLWNRLQWVNTEPLSGDQNNVPQNTTLPVTISS